MKTKNWWIAGIPKSITYDQATVEVNAVSNCELKNGKDMYTVSARATGIQGKGESNRPVLESTEFDCRSSREEAEACAEELRLYVSRHKDLPRHLSDGNLPNENDMAWCNLIPLHQDIQHHYQCRLKKGDTPRVAAEFVLEHVIN